MSLLLEPLPNPEDPPREDHVVRLHGVGWADYLRVLEMRGDHSAPRISYLDGELQIVSRCLPGLDLVELASFVDRPTTSASIREYRATLGQGTQRKTTT